MLIDGVVFDRQWRLEVIPRLQRRDSAPLHLFVAGDVDALCGLHLLEHILAFDHITWEATPVLSYDDLTSSLLSSFAFTRLTHSSAHPATYLLVNCGVNVDLSQLLRLDEPEHDHVLLYVLDSHRPLHFNNAHQSTPSVLVVASDEDVAQLPAIEDEPTDSDDDSDDESAAAVTRRRALDELRERNRARFKDYYSVSYYAAPVSITAFDLCSRLSRESPLALWWAIVGLTDAFVHERIGGGQYDTWADQLNASLDSRNVQNEEQHSYDHPLFPSSNSPSSSNPPARAQSNASSPQSPALSPQGNIAMPSRVAIGHVTFTRYELRLLHLRHLPLYDSMQYSPYLSSHLRRWTDRGVGHIRTLLVEMGIPLDKARQAWMEEEMQWRLREGMEAVINKHPRLRDIRMASFYRQYTPTLTMSAVDAVYTAAALLEQDTPAPTPTSSSPPAKRVRREGEGGNRGDASLCPEFWDAYRAVGCCELPVLMRGLHSSIHLMQLCNAVGLDLMKKKLVHTQGPISYAVLSDGPNLSTLAHPLLLQRLAMFLYDCQRQLREKRAQTTARPVALKPVVVACLAPGRGVYVVVGVQSTLGEEVGEPERSRMASAFRSSAMGVGILDEVRHDSFDGRAMEVPSTKMHRFIEYLSIIPAW